MSMIMNPRQADEAARRKRMAASGPTSTSYLPGVAQSSPGTGGSGFGARAKERFQKLDQPPPDQPPPDQPPPTPRTPQLGDFKTNWKDPEYNAQIASLNKALQDYETGAQQRADRYGQDFRTGVQQMGYRPAGETGFGDVLATPEPQMASRMAAPTEPQKMGQWDLEGQFDPYSSAARGTRGLRDEFAARGTLRSSDFGQTFGEFQNRLSDQLDAMNLSRSRFGEDLQTEIAGQRSGTEERSQAAERAASQRAATTQMNAFMRALAGG